jgi:hypothetical protein
VPGHRRHGCKWGIHDAKGDVFAILALGALILVGIIAISPNITTVANEASTEIYGIDILGLTKNANHLPEQQFAAH